MGIMIVVVGGLLVMGFSYVNVVGCLFLYEVV